MRKCFSVPPGAFRPQPKVTSAVCAVDPLESALLKAEDAAGFEAFLAGSFAQPRKTLLTNLTRMLGPRASWEADFDSLSLDVRIRAGDVPAGRFVRLFERWKGRA